MSISIAFTTTAQDNNCGGATTLDLNTDVLNMGFDIPVGFTLSATIGDPIDCITSPAPQRDAWANFTVPVTGNYVIQFSSATTTEDAILAIYTGTCGALTLVTCVNDFQNENATESIVVNLSQGTEAHIRVISTLTGVITQGSLTVYKGDESFGDICSSAPEVSVGTCDFDFTIGERFFNHESRDEFATCTNFDPTSNLDNRDGWLRFTASETGVVGVEYTNVNQDAALEIYEGDCANLTFLTCTNATTGVGVEAVEFNVTAGNEYFIRVMNVQNADAMEGGVCIFPVISRDDPTDTFLSTPSLGLGDCNIKVNVLNTFDYTTETLAGGGFCYTASGTPVDTWLTFSQNTGADVPVRLEYSSISDHFPAIMVFDAPLNIPLRADELTPSNPVTTSRSCNFNSTTTSDVSFIAVDGQTYYIRVIRPDDTPDNNDMLGSICIYRDEFRAEDNFYTAVTYATDGTNCGEQFNVLGSFNTSDLVPSCAAIPSNDAWAKFQTGAVPGDLIIEYDNDNGEPALANDVALLLYQGEPTVYYWNNYPRG